jgi:hypothetical protein
MTRQTRRELILEVVRFLRARWLAVCLCLAAGVVGGVFGSYRALHGFETAIVDWHGLATTQVDGIGPVRWMTRVATMTMVAPDWRPLSARLDVIAQEDAGTISVEADGWPVASFRPKPGRSTHTVSWRHLPDKREKLVLRVLSDSAAPVGLVNVDVFPRVTPAGRFRHATSGFVTGVLLAALFLLIRLPRPPAVAESEPSSGVVTFGRRVALAAIVAAYLTPWAFIKPVLQAPDEPQHLMKATAVLKQPWLTAAAQFDHDPRFLNPLALWHPPALGRVFYYGNATLSAADIDLLEHAPWPDAGQRAAATTYRVALASYPTLYYLSTFALSEPIIALVHASPYQAIFVYRAATILLASIVWAAVYVELRRTSDLRRYTNVLMVFMLANPMLAFVSSAVNTDALAIPLCIGGAIACWRLFTTGHGSVRTIVWLTAASLVKPAGIQMVAALIAAVLVVWIWFKDDEPVAHERHDFHASATILTLARAMAISAAAFYSWSYIHLFAAEPMRVGIAAYAGTSLRYIPDYWVMYWGQLGWLDYTLPVAFYAWMLLVAAWCAACAWRAPLQSRAAQTYWVFCFMAYAATLFAIEYLYLHEAGYFLQGRYFLPGAIGLATWLLMHRGTIARATLVASVVAINVLLFGATVQRYYAGDWSVAWRALPFAVSDAPSPEATSTKAASPKAVSTGAGEVIR